jgi:hypothetical protein
MSQFPPAAEPMISIDRQTIPPPIDPSQPGDVRWHRRHWAGLMVLGLTLLAAVIRFFSLSSPCLWYDEARVYYRVCGTYGQLLECLRTDGFGPLHYEMVWVMVRGLAIPSMIVKWHWLVRLFPSLQNANPAALFPGPVMMRFIPALTGTLMVPAVYFLSRQMLPIRTALLAAGFTACSAFLIFYSRDSKMYMETWLLITLGMGSLLWWFRTDRSTAWLCWIACFAAACGIHATSMIALPISLLFLLSQKTLRWQKALLWLLGIAVIAAGPIGYYEKFNTFQDRASENWHNSELAWIEIYNHDRTGPDLYRYLGSTMLIGWEWPRDNALRFIEPARVDVPIALMTVLAIILIAAIFPWPRRWRGNQAIETLPQAPWRTVLWLSLWLAVPTYAFYCRSITGFAGPVEWFHAVLDLFPDDLRTVLADHQWPWAVLGMATGAGILAMTRRDGSRSLLLRGLQMLAVFAVVVAVLWAMYLALAPAARAAAEADKPWESVWVPRYIGMIWPALALTVAALLMRLPTRPVRISAIAVLVGVNLYFGGERIFGQTEPPVQLMAADAFCASNPGNRTMFWSGLEEGRMEPGGGNLAGECGEYYYQSLDPVPISPAQFRSEANRLRRKYTAPFFRSPLPAADEIPSTVNRIVVWNQTDPTAWLSLHPAERPLAGWTVESDTRYTIHDFWTWQDLARYRRREYVRTPGQ